MDQLAYSTFELAVEQALKLLDRSGTLDPSLLRRLIEREDIISRQSECPVGDVTAGMSEAHLKVVRYVIRNDLLLTLENFLDLLKHATNFSVSLLSLFNPISIIGGLKGIIEVLHGLAATYRRIKAAGYVLTPEEFAVFVSLKDLRRGSVPQIASGLKGIETEFVERTLAKYQQTEARRSGFFEFDGKSEWQLVGV